MYTTRFWKPLLIGLLVLGTVISAAAAQSTVPPQQAAQRLYLPLVSVGGQPSIFGVEANLGQLSNPAVRQRAAELGVAWVRINGVPWHQLQPTEGGAINWGAQAIGLLEQDLVAARELGLTPTIIIRGAPAWAAVISTSNCSAVREDRLGEYAAFLQALAARYRGQVTYWELGNEPDVDPTLIPGNQPFGCLGEINDQFYGGERYGRMAQVAAAALRRGNPEAKVILGGLLLDSPETTAAGRGNPERFLEGVLRAGAGTSLDVIAFHSYPAYNFQRYEDQDFSSISNWTPRGGFILGKLQFVRETMSRYGVNRPVWINEMGLVSCDLNNPSCQVNLTEFEQVQTEHAVRAMSRSASNGVQMVAWYTINYSNWRHSSLLGPNQQPKPVFYAYQHMIRTVSPYRSVAAVDYGSGIEAYRFDRGTFVVDVLWTRDQNPLQAQLPLAKFLRAETINGNGSVPQETTGDTKLVTVGFTPIYIVRLP